MEPYTLRPRVFGQHLRFLRSATFIDCYLYQSGHDLLVELEFRRKGHSVKPDAIKQFSLHLNVFGLWEDAPAMGVFPTSAHLNVWQHFPRASSIQKRQLARLLVLLAMRERAAIGGYSTVLIHALTPRPCDPCEGLVNHYAKTGRAARDAKASIMALDKAQNALIGKSD